MADLVSFVRMGAAMAQRFPVGSHSRVRRWLCAAGNEEKLAAQTAPLRGLALGHTLKITSRSASEKAAASSNRLARSSGFQFRPFVRYDRDEPKRCSSPVCGAFLKVTLLAHLVGDVGKTQNRALARPGERVEPRRFHFNRENTFGPSRLDGRSSFPKWRVGGPSGTSLDRLAHIA